MSPDGHGLIGMAHRVFLMTYLEGLTRLRFGIWMIVGLVIYFAYGRVHSTEAA